jgi:hypothetical protein
MASEAVTAGSIIAATLRTFSANVPAVALYLLIFTAGGCLADYVATYEAPEFKLVAGLTEIVFSLGGLVGGYLLTEAMLKRGGLFQYPISRRFFPYIGQAILVGLGVGMGLILLIVPGVILALRWMLAAPLLVNGGRAVESIEQSWRLTRGYAGRIFLAGLPMWLALAIILVVSAVGAATVAADGGEAIASVIVNLAAQLITVLNVALAVAVYGLIGFPTGQIEEVFA